MPNETPPNDTPQANRPAAPPQGHSSPDASATDAARAKPSAGFPIDDRDPQQIMDDNMSEYETGNVDLERRPRDSERMRLGKIPNSKRH